MKGSASLAVFGLYSIPAFRTVKTNTVLSEVRGFGKFLGLTRSLAQFNDWHTGNPSALGECVYISDGLLKLSIRQPEYGPYAWFISISVPARPRVG